MAKKKNTPLNIFMESVGLYFSNFDKFVKYMTFPVLGQITGLSLVFLLTYYYAIKMPIIIEKVPALNNFGLLVLFAILITLPGLAIFVKAFWEYLVAFAIYLIGQMIVAVVCAYCGKNKRLNARKHIDGYKEEI